MVTHFENISGDLDTDIIPLISTCMNTAEVRSTFVVNMPRLSN